MSPTTLPLTGPFLDAKRQLGDEAADRVVAALVEARPGRIGRYGHRYLIRRCVRLFSDRPGDHKCMSGEPEDVAPVGRNEIAVVR